MTIYCPECGEYFEINELIITKHRPQCGAEKASVMEKIGAFWLNEDKNGKKYMSGKINGIDVLVFKNTYKKEDRHPDYIVYLKEQQQPKEEPERQPGDDTKDEDIPF